jgi:predicted dehydrogenase
MIKKILIVGFGTSGRRYYTILKKNFSNVKIKIYSLTNKKKNKIFVKNFSEIKNYRPDISILSNPSSLRLEICKFLINLNSNILIEKPLASNIHDAVQIIKAAKKKKICIKIGYNLRQLESLKKIREIIKEKKLGKIYSVKAEVGKYLPRWRKQYYTKTVSAHRSLGGGVISELSHEIDYLFWIFGKFNNVFCNLSRISNLRINVEDNANIIFFKKNNFSINLSLDFCRRDSVRKCYIACEKGSILWNGILNQVKIYKKRWTTIRLKKGDVSETYLEQLKIFFKLVKSNNKIKTDLASLKDGFYVVKTMEALFKSSKLSTAVSIS